MPLSPRPSGGSIINFVNGDAAGYPVVDNTPFYLSMFAGVGMGTSFAGDPSTTAPTAAGLAVPEAQVPYRITRIDLFIVAIVTPGSGEFGSLAILVNNTTATTPTAFSGTVLWNSAAFTLSANGLNIPINAGDFWTVRLSPPVNFATNPTNTYHSCQVYVTPI